MQHFNTFENARGNALFLILIAVALFAALSYAITNSGRGGGGIDKEKASLIASTMAQQLTPLSTAAQKMRVFGTSQDDLEFFDGGACAPNYTLCGSGENCIFAPEGGNVIITNLPKDAFTKFENGWMRYPGDTSGTTQTNIWLDCDADMIDWGAGAGNGGSGLERALSVDNIKPEVCRAYNKGFGYDGIPGDDTPVSDYPSAWTGCSYNSGQDRYSIWYLVYSI